MNTSLKLRRIVLKVPPGAVLLLTAVVAAGLPAASARAADFTNEWKPFGLQGLVVRSLAAEPGRLCAGTEGRGVFCHDAQAPATGWRSLGPLGTTITWIWIDRFDLNLMFAATGLNPGGPADALLYRTLDGGATWEPVDFDLRQQGAAYVYAVDGTPSLPILSPLPIPFPVYAAGDGVWRSDDRGRTWTRVFQFPFEFSLEVPPTALLDTVWAGGETSIFQGFTILSRDGGASFKVVWDSGGIGDNQTSDIAAHPLTDGIVLSGHEGFVLRTTDHGQTFREVLAAPTRFFLDWDRANPARAYAAGSPNGGGGHAFFTPDFGGHWADVTGTALAARTVFRLQADPARLGVVYAATDDGVYRHYGSGLPLCLDARAGVDAFVLWPGFCPPIMSPGPVIIGDAIAVDLDAVREAGDHVDLGEAECLISRADIAFATIDTPEPAPGKAIGVLARVSGSTGYGVSSNGLPRIPSAGDCP